MAMGQKALGLALLTLIMAGGIGACGGDETTAVESPATYVSDPANKATIPVASPSLMAEASITATPSPTPTGRAALAVSAPPDRTATTAPSPTAAAAASPTAAAPSPTTGVGAVGGRWYGDWENLRLGTSGSAMLDIELSPTGSASFTLDLDGHVFGLLDPPARKFTGSWDGDGAIFTGHGDDLFGDMRIGVSTDGAFDMYADNIPEVDVRLEVRGQISGGRVEATYTLEFLRGGSANGRVFLARGRAVQLDGQLVIRTYSGLEIPLLHVRDLPERWDPEAGRETEDGIRVTATQFGPVAMSPEGRRVAWATAGGTHHIAGLLDIPSGAINVATVVFDGEFDSLTWSPDGKHLVVALLPPGLPVVEVYRVELGNIQPISLRITERLSPEDGWATMSPKWRSKTELVFSAKKADNSEVKVWVLDIASGEIRPS